MPAPLPADWSAIRTLAQAGTPLREIAKQTGIAEGTLFARSKREGWLDVVRKVKAEREEKQVAVAVSSGQMQAHACKGSDVVAEMLAEQGRNTRIGLSRYAERMARRVEEAGELEDADNIQKVAKIAATVHGWEGSGGGTTVNIALLS